MRRKSYYIVVTIICTLLFTVHTKAATSDRTYTTTDSTGHNITIGYQNFTNQMPTRIDYIEEETISSSGQTDTNSKVNAVYEITQNARAVLYGRYYYNGWGRITFTVTPSNGAILNNVNVNIIDTNTGLKIYSGVISGNTQYIYLNFDNYKPQSGEINVQINYVFTKQITYPDDPSQICNFTFTATPSFTNTESTDSAINNRYTELMFLAISQATGPQLNDILLYLQDIRNQDYTYYQQIVTSLSSLLTEINNIKTILNNIDLDINSGFSDVQTILDLFPSYRTQVLQYWQDLLSMNAAQSSQAAEMESQYANQGAQSETLLNGLNSLNLPEVDSNDFNLLGQVDTTQKTNFFGLISLITNNSIVTTLLLIIVTGAIVGYILYGKK